MKQEIKAAIQQGIKEAEKNGYKWTITENGLKWSYGEEFTFRKEEYADDDEWCLIVEAVQYGREMAIILVGNSRWADATSEEEAYRLATKAAIRRANSLY
jgi:hypothetical protein